MNKCNEKTCPALPRTLSSTRRVLYLLSTYCVVLFFVETCSYAFLKFALLPSTPSRHSAHITQNADLGWVLTPGITHHVVRHAEGYDVTYRTNSSFRLDSQKIRRVNDCDVILIGDSHVFGFGLSDDQTLAEQLRRKLKVNGEARPVLNAGVPGYGPDQYCLRLKSLGRLRAGSIVVVYVNPINDLVNLSMAIDYRYPKPYVCLEKDRLKWTKPQMYDPQVRAYFAPDFSRLNEFFQLRKPDPVPLAAHLSQWSSTCRLMICLKERSVRFRWSPLDPVEEIGPTEVGEMYDRQRQEEYRTRPLQSLTRVWPAVSEFGRERKHLEKLLLHVFRSVKEQTDRQEAKVLIVVARECYRNQAFWIRLTDILAAQYPQYEFQWTEARDIVLRAASQAGIPTLTVEFPQSRAESMFIPYDGHTSAEGFAAVTDQIIAWMEAEGLEPASDSSRAQ